MLVALRGPESDIDHVFVVVFCLPWCEFRVCSIEYVGQQSQFGRDVQHELN